LIGVVGSSGLIGSKIHHSIGLTCRFESDRKSVYEELTKKQVDVVISVAGNSNATNYTETNFQKELSFNLKLVDALSQSRGKRLLYVSTSHVYGKLTHNESITEVEECNPITDYGRKKFEIEKSVSKYASEKGVPIIVCRVFSIFEKGMKSNFLAGRIEREIAKGERKISIDNSQDLRDFNSSTEIGRYLTQISQRFLTHEIPQSRILNVGSGVSRSVQEVVTRTFFGETEFEFISGYSSLPSLVADVSNLRHFLEG
jgi:nucleoside-diphosphate-sugar epimerase